MIPRTQPLHGANIGCDVVRSTIFAARRADIPAAGEGARGPREPLLDRGDLLLTERLDDVGLAEVAPAFEQDAAFGAGADLADLLLDSAE